MKPGLYLICAICLFSAALFLSAEASAAPFLCQSKKTQKIIERNACRRSERQILDVAPPTPLNRVYMGRTTSQLGPAGAIQYLVPSGAAATSGGPEFAQMPVAEACSLSSLYVKLNTAPGQGETRDFIIVVNGVSEGAACHIADEATTCTSSPAKNLNAGDSVSIESYPSMNPARSYAEYSWICQTS